MALKSREEWPQYAACAQRDPNEMFVTGAAQNVAKKLCAGCPVRLECLAEALDSGEQFGVWGGMTERERRALLRRNPYVESWRRVFEVAYNATAEQQGSPRTVLNTLDVARILQDQFLKQVVGEAAGSVAVRANL